MYTAATTLNIDHQLRLVLFGLECALDVEFDVRVAEQIFTGAGVMTDGVTRYELYRSAALHVWGEVEEYEEGCLLLSVQSKRRFEPPLPVIEERAKYQVFRMERHRDTMERHDDGGD